jgi:HSP20 family protein
MTIITRMPRPTPSDANHLENRLQRLFTDAFGGFDWPNGDLAAAWTPATEVLEDATGIRIVAEVPGVAPADVKISLENNVLTIRGAKAQVAEERTEKVHRYERTFGGFARSFSLPTTVDANGITARYEHGVLTVTLPKVEKARPRQIEVQVPTPEK